MTQFDWKSLIQSYDERRDIVIPGNAKDTTHFAVKQLIQVANASIQDHDYFAIALSGGSTPKTIFQELSLHQNAKQVDWDKVLCFWSDERSVAPSDPENNYSMAMHSGLEKIIPHKNIFRMHGEENIEENANHYEQTFLKHVPSGHFDMMMLGMGEDGHTASLFPRTHALHTQNQLFVANYVTQKKTWRMSATYKCINESKTICIYAIGKNKADKVFKVLNNAYDPDNLPIQKVGTDTNKALWILDEEAATNLIHIIK